MGGGRLNYLGVWNTVSAVRNHPQHGAAARRLLAKWAAAADEEAQREAVRNSLRTAGAAQAPACSQAPQCSGGEAAKENTAPLPATVVNERKKTEGYSHRTANDLAPTTPGRAPNDASQQGGLGGAAPQETSGAPDVAVKFEERKLHRPLSCAGYSLRLEHAVSAVVGAPGLPLPVAV